MGKVVVIIGYGSAGQRHARLLNLNKKISKVYILSSKKNIPFNKINKIDEIKMVNPDLLIIASYAKKHLKYILYAEKYLRNKAVLIEKPLFDNLKKKKFLPNKNLYFVGYNLRFHPIIPFIKKIIKDKKIWFFKVISYSYLPHWRTNIPYYKSASAKKKYGGGALLELSHEIDFTRWILGDFKIIFSINKKNSNLKVDTDDQFEILGKNKRCKLLNISANFFSKNLKREIFIETNRISIHADLVKSRMTIIDGNKKKQISFKHYDINQTFKDEHDEILTKKYSKICKYIEGHKVMEHIQRIKGK